MKSIKLLMGLLVMTLVFGIIFNGCKMETNEPTTYTVWTGVFILSSSDSLFGMLGDGYYFHQELTKTEFDLEKSTNFQNNPEYVWTEDQIFSYLIGFGFSSTLAKTESAWLISIDHGLIGARTGSTLYMILNNNGVAIMTPDEFWEHEFGHSQYGMDFTGKQVMKKAYKDGSK